MLQSSDYYPPNVDLYAIGVEEYDEDDPTYPEDEWPGDTLDF